VPGPSVTGKRNPQNCLQEYRTAFDKKWFPNHFQSINHASVILFLSGDALENNNERNEE
jgi:hypothetical protein